MGSDLSMLMVSYFQCLSRYRTLHCAKMKLRWSVI